MLTEPCLPLWKRKSDRWVRGEVGEARLSMDFRAAGFEYMVAAGSKRMRQDTGVDDTAPENGNREAGAAINVRSITALLPRNHCWAE